MYRPLIVAALLSFVAAAVAQSNENLPGWNNDGGDDVDDHLSHGAEVAGSVVGDAASLATEVAKDAFIVATTIGGEVYTIGADSVQGLENALEAMAHGFEEGWDEGYDGSSSTSSSNGALGIQPWSISYPIVATCAAAVGGIFMGALAVF